MGVGTYSRRCFLRIVSPIGRICLSPILYKVRKTVRFLIDKDTADGSYDVVVRITHADDSMTVHNHGLNWRGTFTAGGKKIVGIEFGGQG